MGPVIFGSQKALLLGSEADEVDAAFGPRRVGEDAREFEQAGDARGVVEGGGKSVAGGAGAQNRARCAALQDAEARAAVRAPIGSRCLFSSLLATAPGSGCPGVYTDV